MNRVTRSGREAGSGFTHSLDQTRATLERERGLFSTESALVKQNIRKLEAEPFELDDNGEGE